MRRAGAVKVLGRAAALAIAVVLAAACQSPGAGQSKGTGSPQLTPTSVPSGPSLLPTSRQALLHPAHKYFGVSVSGVPASLSGLQPITAQTGKTPNLVEYFNDFTHPFNQAAARTACDAGILPALTWESWSWEDTLNGSPDVTQPSYAPRRIAAGAYDGYIKRFAQQVKALGCPIMLRLDQEANGHWYPWGMATAGMHNTPAQYVAMWRHVWEIFHAAGVHNVTWVWSPNFLYPSGVNELSALYPGDKYVDVVGIDGYLVYPGDSPARVFGPIMRELRSIAPAKPWLIAETGAAAGPHQAAQITALLHTVATNKRLIGLIYLDEHAARADWRFSASAASLQAFRDGIGVSSFGQAPAGTP